MKPFAVSGGGRGPPFRNADSPLRNGSLSITRAGWQARSNEKEISAMTSHINNRPPRGGGQEFVRISTKATPKLRFYVRGQAGEEWKCIGNNVLQGYVSMMVMVTHA